MNSYNLATRKSYEKVILLKKNPFNYLFQSILAGLYLTFIGLVFWYTYNLLKENIAIAKIISSLTFGLGLSCIIILKSELFTSNNMYLIISSFEKKVSWLDTIYLWAVCWIGNFIGAIFMALIVYFSGFFDNISPDFIMFKSAIIKTEYSIIKLIFKGILANWVVCLAVWIYLNMKNEMAQIFMIITIIFTFLLLGFEHSIANMGTFSYTFINTNNITIPKIFYNLIWSSIGNIIGGGLFVGGSYFILRENYKD